MSNWWSRVELLARRITLPHGALISWQAQCFGWRRAEFHDKSACKGAILWRVAGRLSYFSTSGLMVHKASFLLASTLLWNTQWSCFDDSMSSSGMSVGVS